MVSSSAFMLPSPTALSKQDKTPRQGEKLSLSAHHLHAVNKHIPSGAAHWYRCAVVPA